MSVRHALLALLSQGSLHGTGLQQEFESRTGELWELNVGQVYTTLQRLERDGLVVEADRADAARRDYVLTQAGRRELDRWLATPPSLDAPPRDELVIKVLVALDVDGVDVGEVIQSHRQQIIEAMQSYTKVKAAAGADDVGLLLIVDAQVFRLEAMVRWLDAAQARIRVRRLQPGSRPAVAETNPGREVSR